MSKKIKVRKKPNNNVFTLYQRKDIMQEAKEDLKCPPAYSTPAYIAMFLIALIADFLTTNVFEDQIYKTSAWTSYVISFTIIFCIDIIIPITFSTLLKPKWSQRKLNNALLIADFISIGGLFITIAVQKMHGISILMPDPDQETEFISPELKTVSTILFIIVPLATTVALTAVGLLRSNWKVFQKFRYLQICETQLKPQLDEIKEAEDFDKASLTERDDAKFIASLTKVLIMEAQLFIRSRELLCKAIADPSATEKILASEPVFESGTIYNRLKEYTLINPSLDVSVDKQKIQEVIRNEKAC